MSFHLFSQLPKELRLMIWRECLPRRVAELDEPFPMMLDMELDDEVEGTTGCKLSHTSRVNACPPIISRVCRESRHLAFESGRFVSPGKAGVAFGCSLRQLWLDSSSDAVHLNWDPAYDPHFPRVGDPLAFWRSTAAKAQRFSTTLAVMDMLVNQSPTTSPTWKHSDNYQVCLKVVSIHADLGPAIDSGLWGRFGERRVVLVDAADHKHKREMHAFWEAHGSKQDVQTQHFFKKYCNETLWVWEAKEELSVKWLMNRWRDEGRDIAAAVRERIWLRYPDDDADWDEEPYLRQHWKMNLDNAWVRNTLYDLPGLHLTVMFRLCTRNCT
jgi:hypothetical protein